MIHPGRGTDASAVAIRETQTYKSIRAKVRMVARDASSFGVLSTGERIAVALVLDRYDLVHEYGTMLDAIDRLGELWLAAATLVQRDGWCE